MPAPRNREEFAALVNDARRRQYLSIRAVARVAQVPATTIQGWLDGRHFPSPALRPNYLILVNHLGLDDEVPDDIWDDSRA
jgi:DNA-binding transcriptional regulator YiaG